MLPTTVDLEGSRCRGRRSPADAAYRAAAVSPPRFGLHRFGYAFEVHTVGQIVGGRYLLRELLGRGGMAEVYRARDTATDRGVAVKILRSVEHGDAARFRSEAHVLSLLDHPGVVRLRGSGTHEGVPYLVLDLAEGGSLAGELAAGPPRLDRTLAVGEQVAEALAHAHRQGIVHRDVKPSNILFDAEGQVRVADFGIARLAGSSSLTRTGQLVGTGLYLAPEQVAGEPVGPEADVYSLGLVVLECVTGSPCYAGGHIEAAVARLHRPPEVPPELPRWLREVLATMTARDPGRRPAASDVATALCRRGAEPVLASTAALDLAAVTVAAATEVVPVTLGARPPIGPTLVDEPAGPTLADAPAVPTGPTLVDEPAGAPGTTVVDETAGAADRTAVLPPGRAPRQGGWLRPRHEASPRTGPRRLRTAAILAGALLALFATVALAWTASRDDASSDPPLTSSTVPSATSVAPTTVTTTPPPTVDQAPAAPPDNGDDGEDGRGGNGGGNGKGKDKDG